MTIRIIYATPKGKVIGASISEVVITNRNIQRQAEAPAYSLGAGTASFSADGSQAILSVSLFRLRRSRAESSVEKMWLLFFSLYTCSQRSHKKRPKVDHRIPLMYVMACNYMPITCHYMEDLSNFEGHVTSM